nr:hypothetical protein [Emcibacter nanhaiensis]
MRPLIAAQFIVRLQGLAMLEGALLLLDLVPEGLVDDPEVGHLLDDPVLFRVQA